MGDLVVDGRIILITGFKEIGHEDTGAIYLDQDSVQSWSVVNNDMNNFNF